MTRLAMRKIEARMNGKNAAIKSPLLEFGSDKNAPKLLPEVEKLCSICKEKYSMSK